MSIVKTFFRIPLLLFIIPIGCTTVKYYPGNFVESLKHPTKFPEDFSFSVQNVEEIANKNPLSETEDVKFTSVGNNKNSSMYVVQVRENGELNPHYHKRHDEVIYVKKGSGIATLDSTRYMIKPGSILQIPSRTVHKFLNTGGERFIAVSIFSPPFDGKDEKKIKEKKKKDRGTGEEKRIATKKPEKIKKDAESSTPKEEPTEKEIQTAAAKSKKLAEKKLNKPIQEEWNTNTEEPSVPSKKVTAEDKKESNESTPAEEPTINIKDLHEKLTKLTELKEEGTISAAEYEEKKDALVKGKDVGWLPEPKNPSKKKISLEDEVTEEKHTSGEMEKQSPADDNIFDNENHDTGGTQSISPASEPPIYENKSSEENESSSEDKLKILNEMKQEGLITEKDYESKKNELAGTREDNRTVSTPPENTSSEEETRETEDLFAPKGKEIETVTESSRTTTNNDRIKELKELYDEGLITEDDYKYKLKKFTTKQTQYPSQDISEKKGAETVSGLSENALSNDRAKELKELYDEGLITENDYKYKLKKLAAKQIQYPSLDVTKEKKEEIISESFGNVISSERAEELKELYDQGLIKEDDYKYKLKQLAGAQTQNLPKYISKGKKNEPVRELSEASMADERVKELNDLYEQGLISEDNYKYKLNELTGAQTRHPSSSIYQEKTTEDDRLSELKELRKQGVISKDDFEFKKSQLLNKH
ncbi:MAG: SHOCT domain-containing protein [Planctomycetota bacterium]|nr:SHOCT domain-containing protein [Planctomycetota bacterium]